MISYKGCRDISRRLAFAALGLCSSAQALGATPGPSSTLQEILVIGTTPVPGVNIDIDKVPGNVQSVLAGDLTQNGTASLTGALADRLGSVSISDSLADPFQPDVWYRGFAASPVLGTPQGLAVYQNGVRINEAFGDSVNWDLIPDIAINRLDIVSSSPLYGLNALGGAMAAMAAARRAGDFMRGCLLAVELWTPLLSIGMRPALSRNRLAGLLAQQSNLRETSCSSVTSCSTAVQAVGWGKGTLQPCLSTLPAGRNSTKTPFRRC